MKRSALLLMAPLALTACQDQPAGEPVVRASLDGTPLPENEALAEAEIVDPALGEAALATSPCTSAEFEGVPLTHCIADPAQHRIRTARAPVSGDQFGTIAGWAQGRDTSAIAFVMNGGAYGDDLRALGYFVENAERLGELNREEGSGNFFLRPNGVFFGTDGSWRILESETFVRTVGTRPQFGLQSGPMLLDGGELHPEIAENGASRAIRNGVGVDAEGRAHFVISDAPLSFGQLARFFRDELGVADALFLDANVSSLWDPATGRMDNRRVGPLLVVERN